MRINIILVFQSLFFTVITYAQYNTVTGVQALNNFISGQHNTSTGYRSMYSSLNISFNSGHGSQTLYNNQANYNTALGESALYYNTIGYENSALGSGAMFNNISGYRNVAVGTEALYLNNSTTLNQSILNTGVGYRSLYNNTSGNFNLGLGSLAGYNSQTGSYNVFVGANADMNTLGYYTNVAAIGSNAIVTNSNMIRFGDNNVTVIGGASGWSTPSDLRVKTNIQQNVPGLNFIRLLEPVTYKFDLDAYSQIIGRKKSVSLDGNNINEYEKGKAKKESLVYTGFIAQDVEQAAKSINYNFSGVIAPQNEKDVYSICYVEFVMPLIKSAQELNQIQDSMEIEIEKLNLNVLKTTEELKKISSSNRALQNINKDGLLNQNYPNPFSNTTIIKYFIPDKLSGVSLVVSSIDGKVYKAYKLPEKSGNGQIEVDRNSMIAGTYIYYLLSNGKRIASKKMTITQN